MKVVRNQSNTPLTQAEMEAAQRFEESLGAGQALFHPRVAAGQPAPNFVVFLEQTGRFAVTIVEGRYSVENGEWFSHRANDIQMPVDSPLEKAWQGAKSIRTELKRRLDLNTYVIPVVRFPDMDEDEDILDEAEGGSVRVFFAQDELTQRLPSVPRNDELQTQLSARYIKREVAALQPDPAAAEALPDHLSPDHPSLDMGDGRLVIQHVDVVNVYVSPGEGVSPRDR